MKLFSNIRNWFLLKEWDLKEKRDAFLMKHRENPNVSEAKAKMWKAILWIALYFVCFVFIYILWKPSAAAVFGFKDCLAIFGYIVFFVFFILCIALPIFLKIFGALIGISDGVMTVGTEAVLLFISLAATAICIFVPLFLVLAVIEVLLETFGLTDAVYGWFNSPVFSSLPSKGSLVIGCVFAIVPLLAAITSFVVRKRNLSLIKKEIAIYENQEEWFWEDTQ